MFILVSRFSSPVHVVSLHAYIVGLAHEISRPGTVPERVGALESEYFLMSRCFMDLRCGDLPTSTVPGRAITFEVRTLRHFYVDF